MRELKFRGYLKKENKMFPVCDLNFNGVDQWAVGLSSCGRLDCGLCEDHYERADVEVMQYTGLKDKNENPIYESDILDYKWKVSARDLLIVEWSERDACFLMGGVKTDYAIAYGEVIGNIHENPELLGDIK